MIDSNRFQLLSLEYTALRAEIVQAISYQHQILLAGYGATGAYFSYVLAKLPDTASLVALVAVPFILLGMTSLWAVECNRMVRASYYIARILWRALRKEVAPEPESLAHWEAAEWEVWIRASDSRSVASSFRVRQHRAQSIVVFWGPFLFSVLASIGAMLGAWQVRFELLPVSVVRIAVGLMVLFAAALWIPIYSDLRVISDLGKSPIPDEPLDHPEAV